MKNINSFRVYTRYPFVGEVLVVLMHWWSLAWMSYGLCAMYHGARYDDGVLFTGSYAMVALSLWVWLRLREDYMYVSALWGIRKSYKLSNPIAG